MSFIKMIVSQLEELELMVELRQDLDEEGDPICSCSLLAIHSTCRIGIFPYLLMVDTNLVYVRMDTYGTRIQFQHFHI